MKCTVEKCSSFDREDRLEVGQVGLRGVCARGGVPFARGVQPCPFIPGERSWGVQCMSCVCPFCPFLLTECYRMAATIAMPPVYISARFCCFLLMHASVRCRQLSALQYVCLPTTPKTSLCPSHHGNPGSDHPKTLPPPRGPSGHRIVPLGRDLRATSPPMWGPERAGVMWPPQAGRGYRGL